MEPNSHLLLVYRDFWERLNEVSDERSDNRYE